MQKTWSHSLMTLILAVAVGISSSVVSALELNTPGKLSVSTEGAFPPFSMRTESGELDGIEIRLWKEIAKRLGLEYEPVILKWESTLVGLMAGQFDVMGTTMDITDKRKQQIQYSDGWIQSGAVLLVRADSPIKSVEEIEGKTIGTLVASTYSDAAKARGAKDIKNYKSEPEAYQDLVNGNTDGVVTDQVAGAYAIKTAKLPLRIADGYVTTVQKGWGLKKDRQQLCRAVNKALADMVADGTYAKITKDIIGIDATPSEPFRSGC